MSAARTGPEGVRVSSLPMSSWRRAVVESVAGGQRFAGMYSTDRGGTAGLVAMLATANGIRCLETLVEPDADGMLHYPSLATDIDAAFWYERALHDLSGIVPDGHPRLDALLLPESEDGHRPLPGVALPEQQSLTWAERRGPADVSGHGIFTLPFGPVRSGVMETIEFLIETPGEDIPHLTIRPHYKHRGIAKQFEGRTVADGVLVAERVEGISAVAHALAYSHAAEQIVGVTPPPRARLIRVIFAEFERVANHLDVTMRLADAAGLAVATARFGWHKETVMRLVSRLCGNRFGRGVVVLGGVGGTRPIDLATVSDDVRRLHERIRSDIAALEQSASFLDRLRGTGPLLAGRAREHGALGPIGRASSFDSDIRRERRTDAYAELPPILGAPDRVHTGDALGRARIRWHELDTSVLLLTQALELLPQAPRAQSVELGTISDGFGVGRAESAQGEVLYVLEVGSSRIRRCFARSASFHNLLLFHDVFAGDVFTDLPFIEASFGLSYAGVAM